MKRAVLLLRFVILITTIILSSCQNKSNDGNSTFIPENTVKEQYLCPMKCTEEVFEKPGKCPVCEMDLEKITKS